MKSPSRYELRECVALLDRGEPAAARRLLRKLRSAHPTDAQILTACARTHAELAEWDDALGALATLEALPYGQDPAGILRAEILVGAGRLADAIEALEGVAAENVVGTALAAVIEFFRDREPAPGALPISRASLWFPGVFTSLLLFLERDLRRHDDAAAALRARSHLLQPDLRPEAFRSPRVGPLGRLFQKLQPEARRIQSAREREVVIHFFAKDLPGAETALLEWLEKEPDFYAEVHADPRPLLLAEVRFALGKHRELLAEEPQAPEGGDELDLARRAFTRLALGRQREAGQLLRGKGSQSATLSQLTGQLELDRDHPERAQAWFRRAFQLDDIALVELASTELACLGIELAP